MTSLWDIASKSPPTINSNTTSDYISNSRLETSLLSAEQEMVPRDRENILSKISVVREITDEELLKEELQYREQASISIASDVNKVHDCFSEVQKLIGQQGESVTLIGDQVENSHSHTEKGLQQIEKALSHQKKAFKCCVISLAVIAGILLLISIIIILYQKYSR